MSALHPHPAFHHAAEPVGVIYSGLKHGNGHAVALDWARREAHATGRRLAVRGRYSLMLPRWVYGVYAIDAHPLHRDPRPLARALKAQA